VARPESYELIGPLAEATLSGLHLDLAIVGVDGISAAAGLTTHHETEASTNRALIDRAERTVVVTDSSKVGQAAFARIVDASAVEELITDPDADADELARLGDLGVTITTV
jgi:DeoR family transcriptional regulator, aga operon transcriptional repressor